MHKNLSIELEISPELPEWVVGDQQRLRQVLLNLLFNAVGGKMDVQTIVRNIESCSSVVGLREKLAKAEAAYRLGKESKSYEKLARNVGLAKYSDTECSDAKANTIHERRVREHMLETVEQDADADDIAPALSSLLSGPGMFHTQPTASSSDAEAIQDAELQANTLLHQAEQFQQSSITPGFKKAVSDMYDHHKKAKGGGASCKVYDVASSDGSAKCKTKVDCEDGYACKKGVCTERGGITLSTDTVLTEFAGMRFGVTRRFILAVMGAAVDCLLMFDFHTHHPGAMYGDLRGCMD